MRKITLTSFAVLFALFASLAWAQVKPKAERITNGPVVKKTTGTIAEISWSTDAQGSSIVKYGTNPNALNETAEAPWGGTKEANGDYNHTVWVKNLRPNTTYYYRVETTQGAGTGTATESQPQQFHTTASR
jgi:phosphodiesterase/alkaline phosphatase D-like protein